MSLDTVRIEDHNQLTSADSLIVAENIQKPPARAIHIHSGKFRKFLPRKNHIITVHQQIFHAGILLLPTSGSRNGTAFYDALLFIAVRCAGIFVFLISIVCPVKDSVNLFRADPGFFLPRLCVEIRRIRQPLSGIPFLPALILPEHRRQVHIGKHLIPRHNESCSVRTEYGIRRILQITLGIIPDLRHHFLRVVTGKISL